MQNLRFIDGEKWVLLPMHGMWQHERLLVIKIRTNDSKRIEICGTLSCVRATERDGIRNPWVCRPRGYVSVPALLSKLFALANAHSETKIL